MFYAFLEFFGLETMNKAPYVAGFKLDTNPQSVNIFGGDKTSDSVKLESGVKLQSVLEQQAGVCRQGETLLAWGPVLTERLQLPSCPLLTPMG